MDEAYDYVVAFEDWIIASEEEENKRALEQAYDALKNYEMSSSAYTEIFKENNIAEIPQLASGLEEDSDLAVEEEPSHDEDEEEIVSTPYIQQERPSNDPADYISDGEYKPVEDMTQEEIQAELEEILGDALGE